MSENKDIELAEIKADISHLKAKENKRKNKKKKSGGTIAIILLLVVLIIVVSFAVVIYIMSQRNAPEQVDNDRLRREENAIMGLLPDKSDQEIQDLLSTVVDKGMVNVYIKQVPLFFDGGQRGKIGIQNIPANHYSFMVDIILNDTGTSVYKSGLIQPGSYINDISLSKLLNPGSYDATAYFMVYDTEGQSDEEIAIVKASITIAIIN